MIIQMVDIIFRGLFKDVEIILKREKNEMEPIIDIIEKLKIICNAAKIQKISLEDIQNVNDAIVEVNQLLYGVENLRCQKGLDIESVDGYRDWMTEVEDIIDIWEMHVKRQTVGTEVDRSFWSLYELFKYVEPQKIIHDVTLNFMNLSEQMRLEFRTLPQRYTFLKGKIDVVEGDYSLIKQHVEMMARNVENFKWLYEHLEDYRSKKVLVEIISYWIHFDLTNMHAMTETLFSDYFDLDIVQCGKEDVLVDCGAFVGDSVLEYIRIYGDYKRIYAFELAPSTYKTMVNNIGYLDNIVCIQKGVGNKREEIFINDVENSAGNSKESIGNTKVQITTIDQEIEEKITLIKMDIEGAEKEAILGAKEHILADKPKLLISSYHVPSDIFEIPQMIDEMRGDYKFYMRFNGHNGIWPCDYVLFAV